MILLFFQIMLFSRLAFVFNIVFNIKYFLAIIINTIVMVLSSIYLQLTRGIGDNVGFSIASIIFAIVTLLLNYLLLVIFNFGGGAILISSAVANIACVVYLTFKNKLNRIIRFNSFSKKKLKEMLKFSIPMIPDGLLGWL